MCTIVTCQQVIIIISIAESGINFACWLHLLTSCCLITVRACLLCFVSFEISDATSAGRCHLAKSCSNRWRRHPRAPWIASIRQDLLFSFCTFFCLWAPMSWTDQLLIGRKIDCRWSRPWSPLLPGGLRSSRHHRLHPQFPSQSCATCCPLHPDLSVRRFHRIFQTNRNYAVCCCPSVDSSFK